MGGLYLGLLLLLLPDPVRKIATKACVRASFGALITYKHATQAPRTWRSRSVCICGTCGFAAQSSHCVHAVRCASVVRARAHNDCNYVAPRVQSSHARLLHAFCRARAPESALRTGACDFLSFGARTLLFCAFRISAPGRCDRTTHTNNCIKCVCMQIVRLRRPALHNAAMVFVCHLWFFCAAARACVIYGRTQIVRARSFKLVSARARAQVLRSFRW